MARRTCGQNMEKIRRLLFSHRYIVCIGFRNAAAVAAAADDDERMNFKVA